MSVLWTIASAARGPVRLITGDADLTPPAPPEGTGWIWAAALGVLGAVVLALGVWRAAAWRLDASRTAEERAFRQLSRRAGLGPKRRERLRRVIEAGMPGVPPVALLVSPTAMERACASAELKPGMREQVRQVRLWLGVAPRAEGARAAAPGKPARVPARR